MDFNIRFIERIDTSRKLAAFNKLFLNFSDYIINNELKMYIPIVNSGRIYPNINLSIDLFDNIQKNTIGKIWYQLYYFIKDIKKINKLKINICNSCNEIFKYDFKKSYYCDKCISNGDRDINSRKSDRLSLKVKIDFLEQYKDKYCNYLESKQKKDIDRILNNKSKAYDYPTKYKTNEYYVLCNEILKQITPQGMKK